MAKFSKVFLCRPTHFKVAYKINPWMGGTVNASEAMKQWTNVKNALEDNGVKVDVMESVDGWPDLAFICNAALMYGKKAYLANFFNKERAGEKPHFRKFLKSQGYEVLEDEKFKFEGAGDVMFTSPTKLWCGFGQRSEKAVYEKIIRDFKPDQPIKPIYCELVDPWYYHLDTSFLPLNDEFALYYPHAFTKESLKQMRQEIELAPVEEADAKMFGCNGLAIHETKTVLMPAGPRGPKKIIEDRGWKVQQIDVSEFLKGGGAVKCMLLKCELS